MPQYKISSDLDYCH